MTMGVRYMAAHYAKALADYAGFPVRIEWEDGFVQAGPEDSLEAILDDSRTIPLAPVSVPLKTEEGGRVWIGPAEPGYSGESIRTVPVHGLRGI